MRGGMKVAFLHLEPLPGRIDYNRRQIEQAIEIAVANGARWIVTPELCVSGYFFSEVAGTDWILPQPDDWMRQMMTQAGLKGYTLFLSHPERDRQNGRLYNSLFVIGGEGRILGRHRKIAVHPGPEEDWSTPGVSLEPVTVDRVKVGLLVCADSYEPEQAATLKENGAQLIICPMAWGLKYGPENRWERRTKETGIPLWACNRTGREKKVDWTGAQSVVAAGGQRLLEKALEHSAVLLFDWDMKNMVTTSTDYDVIYLPKNEA